MIPNMQKPARPSSAGGHRCPSRICTDPCATSTQYYMPAIRICPTGMGVLAPQFTAATLWPPPPGGMRCRGATWITLPCSDFFDRGLRAAVGTFWSGFGVPAEELIELIARALYDGLQALQSLRIVT